MLIPCRCSSFSSCTSLPLNKSRNLLRMEWSPVYHVKGWGKFNRYYGDFCTGADTDEEAEVQIHLHQTEGRLARAIEEALVRIKKRTYGVCEACGHPTSRVRLNVVPWARHCRECKEREHSAA